MRIKTLATVVIETTGEPMVIPSGQLMDVDQDVGRDLSRKGLASIEPCPWFSSRLGQKILLCSSGSLVKASEGTTVICLTAFELYKITHMNQKGINLMMGFKEKFPGCFIS